MKTPSVNVETGASFGCRSRNQPSLEHDMLNIRRTSSASSRASRPVESTTMSTGMRRTRPASVSSTRMTSLSFSIGVTAQSETSATRPRMNSHPSSSRWL